MHLVRTLSALAFAVGPSLFAARSARAGPTVSADVDIGPSVSRGAQYADVPESLMRYAGGFGLRIGWRFDIARFFILPEVGVRYIAVRSPGVASQLDRFFGGVRLGWSAPIRPELHLEPAIFAHIGGSTTLDAGDSVDAGLALDLRIKKRFTVGVHVSYDVTYYISSESEINSCEPDTPSAGFPAQWLDMGIHGGVVFW